MTVPIPVRCAQNPTTRHGLVIPWGNVRLADGGADFRTHHNTRWVECWTDGLCQLCGQLLGSPMVMLCGPNQLRSLRFDEPPAHPECAVYVSKACPMVAGERTHYATGPAVSDRDRGATCPDPGCDCGGWVPTPGTGTGGHGEPAHEWFAVTVTDYALAVDTDGRVVGGVAEPGQVRVVRRVSRPGEGRCWERVPDALDGYTAPETLGGAR